MSVKTVSTVAIAGITGKLGRLIAESILASSQAQVRGFCRDRAKVPVELQSNPRVAIVEGSAEDSKAAREAVRDSDVVVCAYLGPNDFMVNSQEVLIDAAETEKVPRYIASDWALDYTKLKLGDLPPKDPMIQIHDYLGTKDIKPVHILNGAFTPFLVMSLSRDPVEYWGTGDEKWDLTSYETCAQYTAAIALDPSASGILKGKSTPLKLRLARCMLTSHDSPRGSGQHQRDSPAVRKTDRQSSHDEEGRNVGRPPSRYRRGS